MKYTISKFHIFTFELPTLTNLGWTTNFKHVSMSDTITRHIYNRSSVSWCSRIELAGNNHTFDGPQKAGETITVKYGKNVLGIRLYQWKKGASSKTTRGWTQFHLIRFIPPEKMLGDKDVPGTGRWENVGNRSITVNDPAGGDIILLD